MTTLMKTLLTFLPVTFCGILVSAGCYGVAAVEAFLAFYLMTQMICDAIRSQKDH